VTVVGGADNELEAVAAVPSPGRGEIRFDLLAIAGVEAGRAKFERIVTDIVCVIHPTARAMGANPGDWGIDTFVGQLDGGKVGVWQSKFWLKPGDSLKSQQAQIRESFKSATTRADAEGLNLISWTLCIPGTMDPEMTKWWDRWKVRERRKRPKGFEIELWQEERLRGLLMKEDFASIRSQYFGSIPVPGTIDAEDPPDPTVYDGTLFIRQLHEADIQSDSTARRAFFNAEVLTRDINEREATEELRQLRTVRSVVEQMWSTRFEDARAGSERNDGQLPGLYPTVCRAIEEHHRDNPNPVLRDSLIHRTGLVHHLAEDGKVGWVEHYSDVADTHRAEMG
jgi:hypothetical protein